MKKTVNGLIYIIISSISFGIIPLLAKLAYNQGVDTFSVLTLRFIFASIFLLIYLLYKKISLKLNVKQVLLIILLGFIGYSGTVVCSFVAYNYISVGLVTMILYLYPAIVTVLSFFIYKEKLQSKKIISLMMSLIGILLLIGGVNTRLNPLGVFYSLLASICYSIYVIGLCHSEVKKLNTFVMTFYVSLVSIFSAVGLGLYTGQLNFKVNLYSIICIVLLALISTVFALMAFIKGVKIVGPSKASICSNLEPIVSMASGYFILNQKVYINQIIGSAFVIGAILILSINIKRSSNKLKLNPSKSK